MIEYGNVTVMVGEMSRAVAFYTETLGMRLKMRAGDHFAEVETTGLTVGLHPQGPHTPKAGTEGAMSIGLQVADIEKAMAELKAKGVTFTAGPTDDGYVTLAFFADPDGNPLYLCQTKQGQW